MTNRPRSLSPINMALKILVNTHPLPNLVKFRPMGFEIRMCSIYSAPYRLSSTCFGRQIPSPVVNPDLKVSNSTKYVFFLPRLVQQPTRSLTFFNPGPTLGIGGHLECNMHKMEKQEKEKLSQFRGMSLLYHQKQYSVV